MRILLGGSPCTYWSIAQTKNRETKPEGLGWELFKNYLIALNKFKPDFFLYENNKSMNPSIRSQITKELGVEPILINSALVSAQNRQRLYWTNIPGIKQPEDRGIVLRDILDSGLPLQEKSYALKAAYGKSGPANAMDGGHFPASMVAEPVNVTANGKARCLRATYYKDGIRNLVGNTADRKTCVAEPVRIGVIENDATDACLNSRPYRVYSPDGKSVTLCGEGGGAGAKTGLYAVPAGMACRGRDGKVSYEMRKDQKSNTVTAEGPQSRLIIEAADGKTHLVNEIRNGLITIKNQQYPIKLADGFYIIRKLTVAECKRLQTVPEDYIFPVSNTQAYKMLGNGWTCDVISHILSYCPGITVEPLTVLSMYDGMSCGRIALNKLNAQISRYFAAEIDKYAIKTSEANFPDIIHLGDAFQVREDNWGLPV